MKIINDFKDGRNLVDLILLIVFIAFVIIYLIVPWYKGERYFNDLQYSGVVYRIEYIDGYRGVPHILIDTTWRLLWMNELKIENEIQVGDSLVKKRGDNIEIFRKEDGRYKLEGIY